jgi:hypothetical protein
MVLQKRPTCIKIGFFEDPEIVVQIKANASDPASIERRGRNTWLQ